MKHKIELLLERIVHSTGKKTENEHFFIKSNMDRLRPSQLFHTLSLSAQSLSLFYSPFIRQHVAQGGEYFLHTFNYKFFLYRGLTYHIQTHILAAHRCSSRLNGLFFVWKRTKQKKKRMLCELQLYWRCNCWPVQAYGGEDANLRNGSTHTHREKL